MCQIKGLELNLTLELKFTLELKHPLERGLQKLYPPEGTIASPCMR